MTNIGLYTTKAVLIFDSEGKRLISKYYNFHSHELQQAQLTAKEKKDFEQNLGQKLLKAGGEILLYENNLILFNTISDLTFCLVGVADENELLLSSILNGFVEAIGILLRQNIDKRSVLDNLDLVLLALDETVDDGIALETDPEIIASRVSKRGGDTVDMNLATLNEQTIIEAYKQAKERFNLSIR
ncbi:Coatomer subunit zeta-1 [Smittium mucronatum]|uniref:Coatomer subunit zeta n=1 Tax=Smittium mucronatum TaxID=133383 RepID=A0A1R0H0I5_9FUNG|nr:Coatomer subunit zeta-1 [Smittium mucronatum]